MASILVSATSSKQSLAQTGRPPIKGGRLFCVLTLLLMMPLSHAEQVYLERDDFLTQSFPAGVPEPSLLWLNKAQRQDILNLLGRNFRSLRVRYWEQDGRSAWILDEIGKDLPITTGVVVDRGLIESIQVLVFRESRGWEVKHAFFTDQFHGVGLTPRNKLDTTIDGVSGATLSVAALKKQAKLALHLHELGKLPMDRVAD